MLTEGDTPAGVDVAANVVEDDATTSDEDVDDDSWLASWENGDIGAGEGCRGAKEDCVLEAGMEEVVVARGDVNCGTACMVEDAAEEERGRDMRPAAKMDGAKGEGVDIGGMELLVLEEFDEERERPDRRLVRIESISASDSFCAAESVLAESVFGAKGELGFGALRGSGLRLANGEMAAAPGGEGLEAGGCGDGLGIV
ncbi:hypothetical protein HDV00_009756 [Rhizophlyctis rosea]|nr:hypothetical protein HDV00_009756 [Rhizophlyctis rosea]